MRARIAHQHPNASESEPPPEIALAITGIRAMLCGETYDLSTALLDMDGIPDLNRRIYEIARLIPPGTTVTYGDIARQFGDVNLSRAVGKALGENPFPPIIPCHRVLAADGRMHGFSAAGGISLKLRMLQIEGWNAAQLSFFES
jgi:methylated-DNA-[protein]-cysteine S-methyltransferase